WSHWHILVSVLPSIGLVFVLGVYVAAFAADNESMKRTSLLAFVILGLLSVPTYLSGNHSMQALSQDPKISKDLLKSHFESGNAALALLALTGIMSLFALLRFRGK